MKKNERGREINREREREGIIESIVLSFISIICKYYRYTFVFKVSAEKMQVKHF